MTDPIEVDKITLRELGGFLSRLSIGSALTVFGLLGSLVTATLFVAPYVGGTAPRTNTPLASLMAQGREEKQRYVIPSVLS